MAEQPIMVSQEQARAFLVARQGLNQPFGSPEQAVRALFGVQVQYAMSLGVAIAARVKRMKLTWPDDAFNKNPTLVKTWSLRSTLHAHAVEDRALIKAFSRPRYDLFLRWMRHYNLHEKEEAILAAMANGPKTRTEIHEAVPELKSLDWAGWGGDVKGLAFLGHIVLAPSGPGATKFVLADQWLGPLPDEHWTYEEAVAETFRRYLRAHAPATTVDFAYWLGVSNRRVTEALARLKGEVVPVEVEKLPGVRYVLADDLDALRAAGRASGVRLLAKFDPLLMSWRDKELYLAAKHHKTVFQKAGQVEAAVLIDGKVAGIWRLTRRASSASVSVQPFRPLRPREVSRLEKEVIRLRRALGVKEISVDLEAKHV